MKILCIKTQYKVVDKEKIPCFTKGKEYVAETPNYETELYLLEVIDDQNERHGISEKWLKFFIKL